MSTLQQVTATHPTLPPRMFFKNENKRIIYLYKAKREKIFGANPEKEWLHLISYLEPTVAPNIQLSGATGWLRIAN